MSMSTSSKFTWEQMRDYWLSHSVAWSDLDYQVDPDALANVIHPGMPRWLNEYYAHFQRWTFERLLSQLPPPRPGARALDVGCGAGRWSRLLDSHGYTTTGIDLQLTLLQEAKRQSPHMSFLCTPIQDFQDTEGFDLVSTVTVLQHLPFDEQDVAVRQIRRLVKAGGHALILENLRDRAPHMFSHTVAAWTRLFESAGFARVALQRYDYSPLLRSQHAATRAIRGLVGHRRYVVSNGTSDVEARTAQSRSMGSDRSALRRAYNAQLRVCVWLDSLIEPELLRRNLPLPTLHCGFLFKAI